MGLSAVRISDVFDLPAPSKGVWAVWLRNFLYFRYTMIVNIIWVLFEPVLYLGAIGYGLGAFVQEVNGQPYIQFFYPALMTSTGGMVAFFEGTYSSFTKLTRQKTYHTILLAPISVDDICLGEIFWAASKGMLSALGVMLIVASQGLVDSGLAVFALIVLWMTCWTFAAFGFWMAAMAKNYDWFVYSQSGIIVPMTLFCGTYFPIDQMPIAVKWLVYSLPLTHAVEGTRSLVNGHFDSTVFMNLAVLFIYVFFLTNLAVATMKRRILV